MQRTWVSELKGTIVVDNSARISVAARVPAAARCVGHHKDKPLMPERSASHTIIPHVV